MLFVLIHQNLFSPYDIFSMGNSFSVPIQDDRDTLPFTPAPEGGT